MNAVEINNLTKVYRLYKTHKDRVKEIICLNTRKYHHDFLALNDVSIAIKKGETVCIIGQNGSGKSTLLKIICGVTKPTRGSVRVNGRISSLLELGAGFHPEFTGRENVYMNGALMGFSKEEMESRLPVIEAFADIGEFIDQPVKSYSSGMYVRLAFAAAINVDPDILIVDEALSVGDMLFQQRCLRRMEVFRDSGKTIMFVSHDINFIKAFCNKAVLLLDGKVAIEGDPEYVTEHYMMMVRKRQLGSKHSFKKNESLQLHENISTYREGLGGGEINKVSLLNAEFEETEIVICGESIIVSITCSIDENRKKPSIAFQIRDRNGYVIYGTHTGMQDMNIKFSDIPLQATVFFKFSVELAPGSYSLAVALDDHLSETMNIPIEKIIGVKSFQVLEGKQRFMGIVNLHAEAFQKHYRD